MTPDRLTTPHGEIRFPAFLPDGTQGVVRAADAADLENVGVQALVMNTFHLMQKPGSSTLGALGGLHTFSGWRQPILTDSGGFQAYSVIRENPKLGSLTDNGIVFRREASGRKYQLTPEKTIQLQMGYGADILVTLDDVTHADDPPEVQEQAVRRTIAWARRCRAEFDRLVEHKGLEGIYRPRLFGVVQGGRDESLRRRCAEALLEVGFDGYGYGGWPLDEDGALLEDVLALLRALIPAEFPLHGLGIGHPEYIAAAWRLGYQTFDSALPTRDARRGRLYTYTAADGARGDWFKTLYIQDEKHVRAAGPLSEFCDCPACQRYSRGYLHHLFKIDDHLFPRLATLHNLRFMTLLEERLRRDG
ncbi:MAG: queuine tRNA-ribosyltransferase family protein [Chloroflexi bacterium]|nr:queuine tRNA-ribosyltransferase family protein [Chloroflexota bacterium]